MFPFHNVYKVCVCVCFCVCVFPGEIPYWLIFLYFLASLVGAFLFVLGSSYVIYRGYRVLKTTFFPSIQLPHHIQEVGSHTASQ